MKKYSNISYEWKIECVDVHGDIQDVQFFGTFKDLMDSYDTFSQMLDSVDCVEIQVVLVYQKHDPPVKGWAYMEGKMLPDCFSDAYGEPVKKVPIRFKREAYSYFETHKVNK